MAVVATARDSNCFQKDAALPLTASWGKAIKVKHDFFYRLRARHAHAQKTSLRGIWYLVLSAGHGL